MITLATQIMKTFFMKGKPNELNTSRRLIINCTNRLQRDGPIEQLFDPIISNIMVDQLTDSYERFRHSEMFLKVLDILVLGIYDEENPIMSSSPTSIS
jgi:hypothetical protein